MSSSSRRRPSDYGIDDTAHTTTDPYVGVVLPPKSTGPTVGQVTLTIDYATWNPAPAAGSSVAANTAAAVKRICVKPVWWGDDTDAGGALFMPAIAYGTDSKKSPTPLPRANQRAPPGTSAARTKDLSPAARAVTVVSSEERQQEEAERANDYNTITNTIVFPAGAGIYQFLKHMRMLELQVFTLNAMIADPHRLTAEGRKLIARLRWPNRKIPAGIGQKVLRPTAIALLDVSQLSPENPFAEVPELPIVDLESGKVVGSLRVAISVIGDVNNQVPVVDPNPYAKPGPIYDPTISTNAAIAQGNTAAPTASGDLSETHDAKDSLIRRALTTQMNLPSTAVVQEIAEVGERLRTQLEGLLAQSELEARATRLETLAAAERLQSIREEIAAFEQSHAEMKTRRQSSHDSLDKERQKIEQVLANVPEPYRVSISSPQGETTAQKVSPTQHNDQAQVEQQQQQGNDIMSPPNGHTVKIVGSKPQPLPPGIDPNALGPSGALGSAWSSGGGTSGVNSVAFSSASVSESIPPRVPTPSLPAYVQPISNGEDVPLPSSRLPTPHARPPSPRPPPSASVPPVGAVASDGAPDIMPWVGTRPAADLFHVSASAAPRIQLPAALSELRLEQSATPNMLYLQIVVEKAALNLPASHKVPVSLLGSNLAPNVSATSLSTTPNELTTLPPVNSFVCVTPRAGAHAESSWVIPNTSTPTYAQVVTVPYLVSPALIPALQEHMAYFEVWNCHWAVLKYLRLNPVSDVNSAKELIGSAFTGRTPQVELSNLVTAMPDTLESTQTYLTLLKEALEASNESYLMDAAQRAMKAAAALQRIRDTAGKWLGIKENTVPAESGLVKTIREFNGAVLETYTSHYLDIVSERLQEVLKEQSANQQGGVLNVPAYVPVPNLSPGCLDVDALRLALMRADGDAAAAGQRHSLRVSDVTILIALANFLSSLSSLALPSDTLSALSDTLANLHALPLAAGETAAAQREKILVSLPGGVHIARKPYQGEGDVMADALYTIQDKDEGEIEDAIDIFEGEYLEDQGQNDFGISQELDPITNAVVESATSLAQQVGIPIGNSGKGKSKTPHPKQLQLRTLWLAFNRLASTLAPLIHRLPETATLALASLVSVLPRRVLSLPAVAALIPLLPVKLPDFSNPAELIPPGAPWPDLRADSKLIGLTFAKSSIEALRVIKSYIELLHQSSLHTPAAYREPPCPFVTLFDGILPLRNPTTNEAGGSIYVKMVMGAKEQVEYHRAMTIEQARSDFRKGLMAGTLSPASLPFPSRIHGPYVSLAALALFKQRVRLALWLNVQRAIAARSQVQARALIRAKAREQAEIAEQVERKRIVLAELRGLVLKQRRLMAKRKDWTAYVRRSRAERLSCGHPFGRLFGALSKDDPKPWQLLPDAWGFPRTDFIYLSDGTVWVSDEQARRLLLGRDSHALLNWQRSLAKMDWMRECKRRRELAQLYQEAGSSVRRAMIERIRKRLSSGQDAASATEISPLETRFNQCRKPVHVKFLLDDDGASRDSSGKDGLYGYIQHAVRAVEAATEGQEPNEVEIEEKTEEEKTDVSDNQNSNETDTSNSRPEENFGSVAQYQVGPQGVSNAAEVRAPILFQTDRQLLATRPQQWYPLGQIAHPGDQQGNPHAILTRPLPVDLNGRSIPSHVIAEAARRYPDLHNVFAIALNAQDPRLQTAMQVLRGMVVRSLTSNTKATEGVVSMDNISKPSLADGFPLLRSLRPRPPTPFPRCLELTLMITDLFVPVPSLEWYQKGFFSVSYKLVSDVSTSSAWISSYTQLRAKDYPLKSLNEDFDPRSLSPETLGREGGQATLSETQWGRAQWLNLRHAATFPVCITSLDDARNLVRRLREQPLIVRIQQCEDPWSQDARSERIATTLQGELSRLRREKAEADLMRKARVRALRLELQHARERVQHARNLVVSRAPGARDELANAEDALRIVLNKLDLEGGESLLAEVTGDYEDDSDDMEVTDDDSEDTSDGELEDYIYEISPVSNDKDENTDEDASSPRGGLRRVVLTRGRVRNEDHDDVLEPSASASKRYKNGYVKTLMEKRRTEIKDPKLRGLVEDPAILRGRKTIDAVIASLREEQRLEAGEHTTAADGAKTAEEREAEARRQRLLKYDPNALIERLQKLRHKPSRALRRRISTPYRNGQHYFPEASKSQGVEDEVLTLAQELNVASSSQGRRSEVTTLAVSTISLSQFAESVALLFSSCLNVPVLEIDPLFGRARAAAALHDSEQRLAQLAATDPNLAKQLSLREQSLSPQAQVAVERAKAHRAQMAIEAIGRRFAEKAFAASRAIRASTQTIEDGKPPLPTLPQDTFARLNGARIGDGSITSILLSALFPKALIGDVASLRELMAKLQPEGVDLGQSAMTKGLRDQMKRREVELDINTLKGDLNPELRKITKTYLDMYFEQSEIASGQSQIVAIPELRRIGAELGLGVDAGIEEANTVGAVLDAIAEATQRRRRLRVNAGDAPATIEELLKPADHGANELARLGFTLKPPMGLAIEGATSWFRCLGTSVMVSQPEQVSGTGAASVQPSMGEDYDTFAARRAKIRHNAILNDLESRGRWIYDESTGSWRYRPGATFGRLDQIDQKAALNLAPRIKVALRAELSVPESMMYNASLARLADKAMSDPNVFVHVLLNSHLFALRPRLLQSDHDSRLSGSTRTLLDGTASASRALHTAVTRLQAVVASTYQDLRAQCPAALEAAGINLAKDYEARLHGEKSVLDDDTFVTLARSVNPAAFSRSEYENILYSLLTLYCYANQLPLPPHPRHGGILQLSANNRIPGVPQPSEVPAPWNLSVPARLVYHMVYDGARMNDAVSASGARTSLFSGLDFSPEGVARRQLEQLKRMQAQASPNRNRATRKTVKPEGHQQRKEASRSHPTTTTATGTTPTTTTPTAAAAAERLEDGKDNGMLDGIAPLWFADVESAPVIEPTKSGASPTSIEDVPDVAIQSAQKPELMGLQAQNQPTSEETTTSVEILRHPPTTPGAQSPITPHSEGRGRKDSPVEHNGSAQLSQVIESKAEEAPIVVAEPHDEPAAGTGDLGSTMDATTIGPVANSETKSTGSSNGLDRHHTLHSDVISSYSVEGSWHQQHATTQVSPQRQQHTEQQPKFTDDGNIYLGVDDGDDHLFFHDALPVESELLQISKVSAPKPQSEELKILNGSLANQFLTESESDGNGPWSARNSADAVDILSAYSTLTNESYLHRQQAEVCQATEREVDDVARVTSTARRAGEVRPSSVPNAGEILVRGKRTPDANEGQETVDEEHNTEEYPHDFEDDEIPERLPSVRAMLSGTGGDETSPNGGSAQPSHPPQCDGVEVSSPPRGLAPYSGDTQTKSLSPKEARRLRELLGDRVYELIYGPVEKEVGSSTWTNTTTTSTTGDLHLATPRIIDDPLNSNPPPLPVAVSAPVTTEATHTTTTSAHNVSQPPPMNFADYDFSSLGLNLSSDMEARLRKMLSESEVAHVNVIPDGFRPSSNDGASATGTTPVRVPAIVMTTVSPLAPSKSASRIASSSVTRTPPAVNSTISHLTDEERSQLVMYNRLLQSRRSKD